MKKSMKIWGIVQGPISVRDLPGQDYPTGAKWYHECRIEIDGILGRQIGRWGHWQLIATVVRIMAARNHGEFACLPFGLYAILQPTFGIDHFGQFSQGHSVDDGNGVHTHHAFELRLQ